MGCHTRGSLWGSQQGSIELIWTVCKFMLVCVGERVKVLEGDRGRVRKRWGGKEDCVCQFL